MKEMQVIPGIAALHKTLDNILQANPKAVLINFPPMDLEGTAAEKTAFAEAFKDEKRVHFTRDELTPENDYEKSFLPAPFNVLQVSYAPKTYDRKSFAKDGVTRRLILI